MKENGATITWRVLVSISGMMEESTKETIIMIRSTGSASIPGLMAENMKGTGGKGNSMA